MLISIIVAASANNAIGKNNQLLWKLPKDLKFFKNTTWGNAIVMGRKTFESLGNKPLPGRLNIVITRQQGWNANGVTVVHSLDDAVFFAKSHNYKELFVAGGGEIYKEAMAKANQIYLTRVHTEIDGDTFFPEINANKWQIETDAEFPADAKHAYPFSFQLWKHK
ncbi:MAG TPA: dihydrofolate reductase [Chitinophagaceae bacterium]|nr:dihydrofolate reductase [Chitinophagaceae bacterium]